jgi:hypothetical protein
MDKFMDKQCREYALEKMKKKIGASQKLDKYAAGGAAKVRKGEATSSGKQIKNFSIRGK